MGREGEIGQAFLRLDIKSQSIVGQDPRDPAIILIDQFSAGSQGSRPTIYYKMSLHVPLGLDCEAIVT